MKLKNIYILIILLSFNLPSYSQETVVNIEDRYTLPVLATTTGAYYFKDTNNLLDKFVGAWVFDDGIHYFRIVITKHIYVSRSFGDGSYIDDDFDDLIRIRMEYKLGGVEKYNTTEEMGLEGYDVESVNVVESITYSEPSLTSCKRRKTEHLKLEHISSGLNEQLIWTRTTPRIISSGWNRCPDGTFEDNSDFIIPANLVLTKQ